MSNEEKASSSSSLLEPGTVIKPQLDEAKAIELIERLYGLKTVNGSVKELNSYDDRNFMFKAKDDDVDNPHIDKVAGDGYLLKVGFIVACTHRVVKKF